MNHDEDFQEVADRLYRREEWPEGFLAAVAELVKIGRGLGEVGLSFHQALVEAQNVLEEGLSNWNGEDFHLLPQSNELSDVSDLRSWARGDERLAGIPDQQLEGFVAAVNGSMPPLEIVHDWHGTDYIDDYRDEKLKKILDLASAANSDESTAAVE